MKYFVVYSISSKYNQSIERGEYKSPSLIDFINNDQDVKGIWIDLPKDYLCSDEIRYNIIMMLGPKNLWKSLNKLTFQGYKEDILSILLEAIKNESQNKISKIMNCDILRS